MFSKIAALTFVHNINKDWDIACMTLRFATIFQDLLREHFLVPRCTVQTVQKQMLKKKNKTKKPRTVYRFIGGDHNLIQGV